jgi:choline kinase
LKAIILAAGRGSRMKTLTEERPKCLVELRGKSLLDWQLLALRQAGIDEIAIVTGYKAEALSHRAPVVFHNPRWAETNMVSSLACAAAWLRSAPCVVSYSDIFYDSGAVSALISATALLAVTYDVNWRALWEKRFGDPLVDAESFRLTPDGCLAEIGGKPKTVDEIEGQYMGLLRFTPQGWGEVERIRAGLSGRERDAMHMTGTLQRVIDAGKIPVRALPYRGAWGEIDSGEDLAAYLGSA